MKNKKQKLNTHCIFNINVVLISQIYANSIYQGGAQSHRRSQLTQMSTKPPVSAWKQFSHVIDISIISPYRQDLFQDQCLNLENKHTFCNKNEFFRKQLKKKKKPIKISRSTCLFCKFRPVGTQIHRKQQILMFTIFMIYFTVCPLPCDRLA